MEKSGEDLQLDFPFIVATVPFREPGATHLPEITYGKLFKKPTAHVK